LEATDGEKVVAMPDLAHARRLLGNAWTSIDAQAGRLMHRSARFSGAWSTAAFLVHAGVDVFVYCDSVACRGDERFTLRFVEAANEVAVSQLKSARPAYAAIRDWPVDLRPAVEFFSKGPVSAKVGLGATVRAVGTTHEANVVPILWCCLNFSRSSLLLYVDGEIPLNVGIVTKPGAISAIKDELKAIITRQV
jgi:hypothetical protein